MVTYGTIGWPLARDDPDAAAVLLRRHMKGPLIGKQRWEQRLDSFRRRRRSRLAGDGLPSPAVLVYATASLGWLARVHDLRGPETFREPVPLEPQPRDERGDHAVPMD